MGKHFGNLQKLSGVNYYFLSPYELSPLKGFVGIGIRNVARMIRENIFLMGIPLTTCYLIYDWACNEHIRLNRKNPEEFKDDV